ncbi:hypothetical protein [Vibrio spartinae]|uniref:Uncharacterized protein n=1 Tax=Vibrio spartinae TaxID=1918945 RepID=A0A1N6M6N1_9VIBR|nr:hypothetical protein [Vibrio spartinae]SIO95020.1 hypothetical protein VSP9026_02759 [Vibrio spartinae]
MHDYNAFFQERGIDWDEVYQQAAANLSTDMTDSELLAVIKMSLSGFSDDHVSLTDGDEEYSPAPPKGVLRTLQQGFLNQTAISDFDTYIANSLAQVSLTQQQMMDSGSVRVINGSSADTLYGAERIVWNTTRYTDGAFYTGRSQPPSGCCIESGDSPTIALKSPQ